MEQWRQEVEELDDARHDKIRWLAHRIAKLLTSKYVSKTHSFLELPADKDTRKSLLAFEVANKSLYIRYTFSPYEPVFSIFYMQL